MHWDLQIHRNFSLNAVVETRQGYVHSKTTLVYIFFSSNWRLTQANTKTEIITLLTLPAA
jgi:hypothetical protein